MVRRFNAGNIVKIDDIGLVIINKYRTVTVSYGNEKSYEVVDWIAFNHSNMSGCTRLEPYESNEMCWECDTNDSDTADFDCGVCKGTGYYKKMNKGMSEAVILADCAKSYIIKKLTKDFDF
jgi:maleate cis-trans isomerase